MFINMRFINNNEIVEKSYRLPLSQEVIIKKSQTTYTYVTAPWLQNLIDVHN